MDNIPTPGSAIIRERGFSAGQAGCHASPARVGLGIERPGPRRDEDNLSPSPLPKAFESMLKTTTETGDIGIFSIKSSQVPPPVNGPRRVGNYNENGPPKPPQRVFQQYGPSTVDDRRRLPSYARDTTSELISMYESPSQKSSHVFDDTTDYRSCSMTQSTSFSLSNHRSYTSLRSQPNEPGLLQRPRSPFAYPTPLRRSGFRPSSPALTDGGGVDYRRRAELNRSPYGPGHNASSPSSLYAQKRKPPMLRPDGNRSHTSLLSQPSPPRRCSSPLDPHSGNVGKEWSRRLGPSSVNTSPARSTFSLSSTVNMFAMNQPPSNTTTLGKAQPSTPLYYDYTEEFDVEEYSQPAVRDPPPQFRIAETIPEDCAIHTDRASLVDPNAQSVAPSPKSGVQISSSSASILQVTPQDEYEFDFNGSTGSVRQTRKEGLTAPTEFNKQNNQRANEGTQLQGLYSEAQDLNKHAEEVFGLSPVKSISSELRQNEKPLASGSSTFSHQARRDVSYGKPEEDQVENSPSMASEKKPKPNEMQGNQNEKSTHDILTTPRKTNNASRSSYSPASSKEQERPQKRSCSLDFSSARPKKMRSSGFNSIDTGLSDLAELLTSLENVGDHNGIDDTSEVPVVPPERAMNSPTVPDDVIKLEAQRRSPTPPLQVFSRNQTQAAENRPRAQSNQHHKHQRPATDHLPAMNTKDLSLEIPRKSVSRSGSPMHSPKPISPVRQLKLKNSVPQLMKALPPLPLHLRMCAVPVVETEVREVDKPSLSPPKHLEHHSDLPKEIQFPPKTFQPIRTQVTTNSQPLVEVPEAGDPSSSSRTLGVKSTQETLANLTSPPKLRLKMRISGATKSSPHDSRPWNSEDNYPWSSKDPSIRLASMMPRQKSESSKPARFKLKASRTSKSLHDTIKINREAGDPKVMSDLHMSDHKDLFNSHHPPTGLSSIFRHVGQHLHSRKASTNSSHPSRGRDVMSGLGGVLAQSPPQDDEPLTHLESQLRVSNESSKAVGSNSLQARFSNLKNRLSIPYLSRSGSRSCDNVTMKGIKRANGDLIPLVARSVPNLRATIELSVEVEDTTLHSSNRARRLKLKDKLSKWIKGARRAIAARVRSLSSTG
ncbi:hypothetical protein BJ875DRAFT_51531 [Amylocarpus encephaloides]|uniref:Uncharacterized protein n=1 Tax=Amylocarpus encephaloides TaxID=45428 RepID=A0A9P7YHR9_9HELO|nr:hypothetical protein BJ875DRAFT_51531 [Amylocarpus encephaloides]